jgi:hypothetical protein
MVVAPYVQKLAVRKVYIGRAASTLFDKSQPLRPEVKTVILAPD